MKKMIPGLVAALVLTALPAIAQDAAATPDPAAAPAVSADVAYIFNTLLFLIGGFLVMWMAAGFAMLEAGSGRKTSPRSCSRTSLCSRSRASCTGSSAIT